jgi:NAD(P)-dependent dehydrogenase (short-subunit alcohol dehydrogenase family)
MKTFEGRVAVVTGAASGIGRAVSLALAEKGCSVALCDRNEAGLAAVAESITALGRRATCHAVDVSSKERMRALPAEVLAAHGGVNILVNNAGVTAISSFESQPLEDFEWLMSVNFWGVVYGCKFFLPALRSAEEGHIVNLSSVFGLMGVPMQSSYCSSKFAVRGFSESLRAELWDTRVGVTSVHPAGVATNIVNDARFAGDLATPNLRRELSTDFATKMLPPEKAAAKIVDAIRKNRSRVLVAKGSGWIDLFQRLSPALTSGIVPRVWHRQRRSRLE